MFVKQKTVTHPLAIQVFVVPDGEEATVIELNEDIREHRGAPLRVEVDGEPHPDIFTAEKLEKITLERPAHRAVKITAEAQVTLQAAGRLQGMKRAVEVKRAFDWLKEQGYDLETADDQTVVPQDIWQTFLLARFERAACIGALVRRVGIPDEWLTVEGFANAMPEALEIEMARAAYDLNEHWDRDYRGIGSLAGMDDAPKKVS